MRTSILLAALLLIGMNWVQAQPYLKHYGPEAPGKAYRYYTAADSAQGAAIFQPDMLPHSPEAEAMIKSTALPVTLYSGMADISVPVFDIKTRNLDVPISLAYNYNGFKPAEVASYAGLGWSVQGGGVITRTVKYRVDHEDPHVLGNDYDDYLSVSLMDIKQAVLINAFQDAIDGAPDLYAFNFNGYSGKFIMLQGKAYLFPHQDLDIEGGEGGGFIITTPKGDHYEFKTIERAHHHQTQGWDYVPDHNNAFFLSRIVSADLSDTISYGYTPYTYNIPPVYSETLSVTVPGESQSSMGTITAQYPQTLTKTFSNGDWVNSQLLSSISSKNYSVNFNLEGQARKDIFFTDGSLYALGSISILANGSSVLNKTVQLHHQYFNGKLNLTEVDVQTMNGDLGIDSSKIQRYQYQYNHPDSTATIVPGWDNQSIDYFGYYNSQVNAMLFTSADVPVSNYPLANRNPGPGREYNTLSQVTFPTGGRAVFTYVGNQTGYIDSTDQLQTLYSSTSTTVSGTDNSGNDVQDSTLLVLQTGQTVHVHVGCQFVQSGQQMNSPIFYIPGYLTVNALPSGDTTYDNDISLPAGQYYLKVSADRKGATTYATVAYQVPLVINTLGPAPGVAVSKIAYYDNINQSSPALVKNYSYTNGFGLFHGGTSSHYTTIVRNDCETGVVTDSVMVTIQSGLFAPISDLINNQFYYANVIETDVGAGKNGKTEYVYNCNAPTDPDVFLVSKKDFGYNGGAYIPLKRTVSNYSVKLRKGFSTFQSSLLQQQGGASGGGFCTGIQEPDITAPIWFVQNVYTATTDMMPSGYNILNSQIDTVWDMNGQNPIRQETDYFYDNPSYLMPTRIAKNNSKGELETTWMTYPRDYNISGSLSPAQMDSVFDAKSDSANAQYFNCYEALVAALAPYQPYSSDSSVFSAVANSYHCESNYKNGSETIYANRNQSWVTYDSLLLTGESNDPDPAKRALYCMQQSRMIAPVIEKYITVHKSDGNDYLVSAVRNNYSIVSSSGHSVAKPSGLDVAEMTSLPLLSSFLSNKSAYYKSRVSMGYDSKMAMITQHKIGDVNYCYLWGYNHQFVVAQVVGSDSATIAGLVNQAVLDNINTTASAMRTELNKIRTGLAASKALVKTCTYDPLIGMTTETDPAGRTTFYEYDGLGRLIDVKDLNGNIIKTYQYHLMN